MAFENSLAVVGIGAGLGGFYFTLKFPKKWAILKVEISSEARYKMYLKF